MQQLKDIFCYFHQYIIPISNSIELLDQSGSYRQIPCELRNVQSHLYRYFHKNKDADGGDSKELKAGLSHMQRAVLDGFKILHRLLVNRCYGKNDQSDHWILKANQQSDLNYNHGPIEKSIENWKVASEYLRSALVVSFENPPSELIKALDSIGVGLISETDLPDPNMEVVQLLIKPFGTLLNLESKLNIWTGVRSEGHNKFHLDLFMELAYAAFGAKTQNYSKLIGAQEAIYVKNLNQFFEDKLLILHKSFAITSHAPHEAYGIYQSFIAQVKPVSIPAKALWQDKNLIQQWLLRLNSITNIPNTYAEIITKFSTDEVFASQNQVLVESMIADLERNKRECADQKARQLSENRQEKNLQLQKEQLKKYEIDL